MTIAAGFRCINGVLVCADTLHSGFGNTVLETKVDYLVSDIGSVVFAYAGHPGFAKATILSCKRSVEQSDPNADILNILTRTVNKEYRRLILSVPAYTADAGYHFRLLLGVRFPSGETELYSTEGASLFPCRDYECIGEGSTVALYLLKSIHSGNMTVERAMIAATHIMVRVKGFVASTGGPTQIAVVKNDHSEPKVNQIDLMRMEYLFGSVDSSMSRLLLDLSDRTLSDEAVLESTLKFFTELMNQRTRFVFGDDVTLGAPPRPPETTGDQSLPRPSPGSPGGTDES
jgi:20S proteasome alpha/beta subunit